LHNTKLSVTRISPVTGKTNTLQLNISSDDYERWKTGDFLIQNIFPHLTDDEREFIISGCLPGEFELWVGQEESDTSNEEPEF